MKKLNYLEQQVVLTNNTWFDIEITFWNEEDDETETAFISTQYPNYSDVQQTLEQNGLVDKLKEYGGRFDFFEIKK